MDFNRSQKDISQASSNESGVIAAELSFPSGFIPAMKLCAQSVTDYTSLFCTETEERGTEEMQKKSARIFELNIPPGEYFIFETTGEKYHNGVDFFIQYYAEADSE